MHLPRSCAPIAGRAGRRAFGLIFVEVVVQHPPFEPDPLVLDLIFDGLQHRVVITVVKLELLFPARRKLQDYILRLRADLLLVSNDVDVNVAQIGSLAVTRFLQTTGNYAGNVSDHPHFLAGDESAVISGIADFLNGDLSRVRDLCVTVF